MTAKLSNNVLLFFLLLTTNGSSFLLTSVRTKRQTLRSTPRIRSASFQSGVTTISSNNKLIIDFGSSAGAAAISVGPLMLSSSEEAFSDHDNSSKLQGRKTRVIMGYKAMTLLYIAVEVYSACKLFALKTLPASTFIAITSYIALPAGISYILISAAEHDRLGSDTYKRLNLSLLEYAMIGLSVIALSGGGNQILKVAYILSLINTVKGYAYGVLGWDKKSKTSLLQDFTRGIQSTIKGICSVPKNWKSFGYFSATLMLVSMKLLKLKDVIIGIQSSGAAKDIAMSLARFNRLSLLTFMIYTLKDAADRDRLGGTTFIQLNYLCALVLGIVGGVLGGGVMTPLGGSNVAIAIFCVMNGILGQK